VTSAIARLTEQGLVEHQKYGPVKLTNEGLKIARDVCKRHNTLKRFLVEILKVSPEIAEDDACRMEHLLSQISLDRLSKLTEFTLDSPSEIPASLKDFEDYLKKDKRS
jgi:DtxR family Mn-dependent transcriptional regulator